MADGQTTFTLNKDWNIVNSYSRAIGKLVRSYVRDPEKIQDLTGT